MEEEILIDSSAWILSFTRTGYSNLKLYIRELILSDAAFITGMVRLELLRGVKSEREATELRSKLGILKKVEAPDTIWEDVALLYRALRKKGTTLSIPDLWIAQIAMERKMVLLHCDRDFEIISRHFPLKTLPIK